MFSFLQGTVRLCKQVSQTLKYCLFHLLNDIGFVIQLVQFVTVPNSSLSIYLYWAIYIYIYIYIYNPQNFSFKYTDLDS